MPSMSAPQASTEATLARIENRMQNNHQWVVQEVLKMNQEAQRMNQEIRRMNQSIESLTAELAQYRASSSNPPHQPWH
jgi:HAMP domain-containing protein